MWESSAVYLLLKRTSILRLVRVVIFSQLEEDENNLGAGE